MPADGGVYFVYRGVRVEINISGCLRCGRLGTSSLVCECGLRSKARKFPGKSWYKILVTNRSKAKEMSVQKKRKSVCKKTPRKGQMKADENPQISHGRKQGFLCNFRPSAWKEVDRRCKLSIARGTAMRKGLFICMGCSFRGSAIGNIIKKKCGRKKVDHVEAGGEMSAVQANREGVKKGVSSRKFINLTGNLWPEFLGTCL